MATEPKTEAKTEARQEAKTEARQEVIEGNTEPSHKYKTWMLKVSVHCEQCKRKVKKVLDSIDGVYSTDIDLRLQKATVVGDVDADTLIKRLKKKTRKHAELWPEKAVGDQKEAMKKDKAKNKEKGKEKEEQRDQESSNEAGGDGENEKEIKDKAKVEKMQDPSTKNSEIGSPSNNGEGGGHVVTGKACEGGGGAVQAKEVKVTGKQPVASPDVGQSPVADKKVGGESEFVVEKTGGGAAQMVAVVVKRRRRRDRKGITAITTMVTRVYILVTRQQVLDHQVKEMFKSKPRPLQITSLHVMIMCMTTQQLTMLPQCMLRVAMSRTLVQVMVPRTMLPQYSYAYMNPGTHPGTFSEPPPYDFHQYSSQPSDSFDILSDENPNACSIM
ncbi:heavy metal-associated isoprenylated plant protein [Salix suchowensis]|nr:heavy metal-associated isoprenylated plant protein [Salix suchowensis]